MYTYIFTCIYNILCVSLYVYIYIYIEREKDIMYATVCKLKGPFRGLPSGPADDYSYYYHY